MSNSVIVHLNVGGTKYVTSKSTLRKYPQSMLGVMFTENVPLSTDEDGYYFIDRCGHIFQYILQFLRCGKLVLPKQFNEFDLLQTEADFYQIEDLISAIEHHKREMKVKERDGIHILLFCILHYREWGEQIKEVKLFKNSKNTDPKFVVCDLDDFSGNEENIRGYLQSDCWELKEHKMLENYEARGFFLMRGMEMKNIFMPRANYTVRVETWIRSPSVDF